MNFLVFEEGGKFLAARVLSQAQNSFQAELDSGKRVKLKAAQVLLQFDEPSPEDLLKQSAELAASMDVQLVWECASDDEFGFAEIARDYFNAKAGVVEQVASLMCLFNAPHYFRRLGKGRFKKASAEIVQQALVAIEKKKQIAAQIQAWAQELMGGSCPEPIRAQLYKILFKPDKNAPEYKAVVQAARSAQAAPLALLQKAGAISSAYEFHWQRFVFEHFPKGVKFPVLPAPLITDELPVAQVQAFSIDDSQTTEIDDALSVSGLGSGTVIVGIHIAAPGLALKPDSALDHVARERMSTVYTPGHKITMLPEHVVEHYTLAAGRDCPALSLYVTIEEATLTIQSSETKIERVPIAHNLRHDQLDDLVTQSWLQSDPGESASEFEFSKEISLSPVNNLRTELSFLYRLACSLKAQREQVRGKPESFNRPDYNFRVTVQGDGPVGDELVEITVRQRGAPLDLIVAEAMILANSTWGQWLNLLGVPAIYRSQASLAPGVKVRMGTRALPHAGIGVKAYAWSTSPLRRYADLVNQWQLIACVRHGATAALAAPFKPKDAQLMAIVSSFDAAYTAYNAFQSSMERYWTMRYVQQRGITELTATVVKDGLARAEDIPLVMSVAGLANMSRGTRVRIRLGAMDLLMLEASGTLVERLDTVSDSAIDEIEDDDELEPAGVQLALDVNDSTADDPQNSENAGADPA